MEVHENLIVAKETSDGFTWTLTSRLGNALSAAEELFGPRDMSWTILGFEFTADGPRVWYPRPGSKQVIIQLNTSVATDPDRAVYQLCHEVIHCLSPNGSKTANVLEEGLATYFSLWYPLQHGFQPTTVADQKYDKALSLTMQLLAIDRDLIKRVRTIQPNLSAVTAEQLINLQEKLPFTLADTLLKSFYL
jgi:hypothetical protein